MVTTWLGKCWDLTAAKVWRAVSTELSGPFGRNNTHTHKKDGTEIQGTCSKQSKRRYTARDEQVMSKSKQQISRQEGRIRYRCRYAPNYLPFVATTG